MLTLTLSDGLLIASTIAGPVLAVQAQKVIEKVTEKRRRKLHIFYALMGTRATRVAPDHVQALNMIDMEFSGRRFLALIPWQTKNEKAVTDAWHLYSDKLGELIGDSDEQANLWSSQCSGLFTDMLYTMSVYFKFHFDKIQLKRGIYYPRAHGDQENIQKSIQTNLARLLSGEIPIKMNVVGLPIAEEAVVLQRKIQEAILRSISSDGGFKVEIKSGDPASKP